ncbi:acyl-CoA dehydrogenase family protein [Nocardiopsis sp. MG754419]|uniref:acyl-CoA dehydrogenase family protein n=1 Tax=Nocardiopsis sp. MG754419 TaxID=2259865 RepID=UPI001BA90C4A|nr:acyl-CoA dehydrogenase family protein [Nocardiopsis sp. MG754419]MBR8743269.1 acyl-CoA dehydrogenase [Nocardiopsis sp. MG754419]
MTPPDTPGTDRWNTPERAALRATVRGFAAREILPHVERWEDEGEIPRDLHGAAARLGLLGLGSPPSVGGEGTMLDQLIVSEEAVLAGVPTGVLASLFTHTIALPALIADGREHLVRDYVRPALAGALVCALAITEPDAGSDVAHLRTRAFRDGDAWVLNGTKTFITSGHRADVVTVAARTSDTGHEGISLFVVERGTPGFTATRRLDKMGWRSSDTAELSLVDVRVPADRLVGEPDRGFHQIMDQFAGERIGLSVQACAMARRCVDLSVEWVRTREAFGGPLARRQVLRHRLAEMHRRTEVATTYVRHVAERLQDGEPLIAEVAMAKNTATETLDHVVDNAVQLHGGSGFMRGTEVERHYRDARVFSIGGGTYEIMNEVIAKFLPLR